MPTLIERIDEALTGDIPDHLATLLIDCAEALETNEIALKSKASAEKPKKPKRPRRNLGKLEGAVMHLVTYNPGLTLGMIARGLNAERTNIARVGKRLEEKGLLRLQFEYDTNTRRTALHLYPAEAA